MQRSGEYSHTHTHAHSRPYSIYHTYTLPVRKPRPGHCSRDHVVFLRSFSPLYHCLPFAVYSDVFSQDARTNDDGCSHSHLLLPLLSTVDRVYRYCFGVNVKALLSCVLPIVAVTTATTRLTRQHLWRVVVCLSTINVFLPVRFFLSLFPA